MITPTTLPGPRPASPNAMANLGTLVRRAPLVVILLALAACAGRGGGEAPGTPPGVVDGGVVDGTPTGDDIRADPASGDTVRAPGGSVQPGAPGAPSRALSGDDLRAGARHAHTEADVRFMENMIHHHAQAVEMSRLVPDRTENPQILLLARRIDRSQDDEIELMARWLRDRGEDVPSIAEELMAGSGEMAHDAAAHDAHAHHDTHGHPDDELMAGMLTPEQLQELAAARGDAFDRLFLEFMIYHHEGAIDMVEELFATRGAAQDTELFQFASHVDADQRIEIGRMTRMLREAR